MSSIPNVSIGYQFNGDVTATNKINASQVDTQLAGLATAQNQTKAAIDRVLASDNTLAPATVRLETLDATLLTAIASAAGWQPKATVAVATTANITLSGEQTIDGVLTSISRVLVKNQTVASQNGIYVSGAGVWTRATDADTAAELGYAYCFVSGGTVAANTYWIQVIASASITLGTTSLSWTRAPQSTTILQTFTRLFDGLTGASATFLGNLLLPRNLTIQDKSGTLALAETSTIQGFKNLLHNGRVEIDQRATLATPATITTGTPTYGPDGFVGVKVSGSVVATVGKVAVVNTPMTGSLSACKLNVTTATSTAAGDQIAIRRVIEGNIFSRASFGSAQAASLYLSFWVESSTIGIVHISLRNAANNRSYVTTYNVASANTRTLCQATIPGDTGGTWVTDANASATLDISGAVGSTYWGTKDAWSASDIRGTSASGILGNAVHSISISDVYLGTEPISGVTTDYPHVPYDAELTRCQRYYTTTYDLGTTIGTLTLNGAVSFATIVAAAVTHRISYQFPVAMRAAPTVTVYNPAAANSQVRDYGSSVDCTSTSVTSIGTKNGTVTCIGNVVSSANNRLVFHYTASAEL